MPSVKTLKTFKSKATVHEGRDLETSRSIRDYCIIKRSKTICRCLVEDEMELKNDACANILTNAAIVLATNDTECISIRDEGSTLVEDYTKKNDAQEGQEKT